MYGERYCVIAPAFSKLVDPSRAVRSGSRDYLPIPLISARRLHELKQVSNAAVEVATQPANDIQINPLGSRLILAA